MEEKTRENMITTVTDLGESVDFYVLEETRINIRSHLLVTNAPEGKDGECYILKDMSRQQDAEAVYEFVEDDSELDALMKVFEELLSDTDVDLKKQIERKIGGINLNLEEKENTAETAPETAAQVTIQAVQENNAQGADVRETAETTTPQEQSAKRLQNRRPARKRTVSKKRGRNGEAQKNPDPRQGQTKSKTGRRRGAQTETAASKSKDSAGTRTSKGTGSSKVSRGSGESEAARNSGESKALPTPARQEGRDGRRDGRDRPRVVPLGGLEQIGTNITAFKYEDNIIVVNCELAFPGDDMLGIDLVVPDVTYLKQNINKVEGFVITRGHEDHVGALSYILQRVSVPIYDTKLTIALIERELEEHRLLKNTKRKVIKYGQPMNLGYFRMEFVKINHSIQDASTLAIFMPVGAVLHTGDFKIDCTPMFRDPIDLQRFAELGEKGVLALVADSTNTVRPGFTMPERTAGKTFDAIFAEHQNRRIIVATFAPNMDRVQQMVNITCKYGRKVMVEGRSVVTIMGIASKLGYISVPEGTLIDIEHLKNYPPGSTVLITTGNQGGSTAALSRVATSIHRKISIVPGDMVVLSSTPIPGNERAVANVVNGLSVKGAKVICQDTHVSGHACQEDLRLIYSLVHPKFSIPIHGEYRHRMAQRELAQFIGVQKENAVMINSGDVVALDGGSYEVIDHVACGGIFVDGLGVSDVGNTVSWDRQDLAQNGIIVVVLTLEKHSNQLLASPDIVSGGFVYVRESEDLLEGARIIVYDAMQDCLDRHVSDWGKIENIIKDSLGDFLWRRMKRDPMILPIIMEV